MAQQTDAWKRYLDAGLTFTQLTRSRADAIVKDLVKAGAVQREKTEKAVEDLMDRSRKNTDLVMALVRKEVRSQLSALGFATKDDVARLERRLDSVAGKAAGRSPTKAAPSKTGKAAKARKVEVTRVPEGTASKAPARKATKKGAAGGTPTSNQAGGTAPNPALGAQKA